jgi:hypothetical protein
MKRFFIFTMLFPLVMSVFAQEYYYWYRGEKQPLILDPARKYVSVHSANDTLALKNKLIEQNIHVPRFIIDRWMSDGFCFYGVIVESDHFPDFRGDETIAYEGGYFLNENGYGDVGALAETFWVRLKSSDDLSELQKFAEENNVTIMGRDKYMSLWYYLFCTKASKGNAMQLGNLCYESGLCDAVDIGFTSYGSDALPANNPELEPIPDDSPTSIALPTTKSVINVYRESRSSIAIEAAGDLIKEVEIFDLSGKILHKSSYSGVSRVNWKANKGLYFIKIRLQSGNRVFRKIII